MATVRDLSGNSPIGSAVESEIETPGGSGGTFDSEALGSVDDPKETDPDTDASLVGLGKGLLEEAQAQTAALADESPVGVQEAGYAYEIVAASDTDEAVGVAGDTLVGFFTRPTDASPAGNVVVKDGATTIRTIYAANMGTDQEEKFWYVGLISVTGWTFTTPSDVSVVALYRAAP
jgi:hypothetical protein